MNIMIITGSFGTGHNSAAHSIKEELEKTYKDANVFVVDLVTFLFPSASKNIYAWYNSIMNNYSSLYNRLAKADNYKTVMPLKHWFSGKFETLIAATSPDLVITTWPIGTKYIGDYERRTGDKLPHIACVTDIVAHKEWICESVSAYIVGDKCCKEQLIEEGILPEKIHIGGIPVRDKFKKNAVREAKNGREILIMGGGLGLMPDIEEMMQGLETMPDVHVTVITGHNKKLYDMLSGKYPHAEIIGYTEDVDKYMRRADFVITKAGGITLFEAIYTETPIFTPKPFLEQENGNAEYIEKRGIGAVINDVHHVISRMDVDNWEKQLGHMRRNMRIIKSEIEANALENIIREMGIEDCYEQDC